LLSEFLGAVAPAVNPKLRAVAAPMVSDTPDKLVNKLERAEQDEDE